MNIDSSLSSKEPGFDQSHHHHDDDSSQQNGTPRSRTGGSSSYDVGLTHSATNSFTVAYPYTPLPANLVEVEDVVVYPKQETHRSSVYQKHLEYCPPVGVPGCAKTDLWGLRYKEVATAQEFTRFCHGSLEGAAIVLAFGLASLSAARNPVGGTFLLWIGLVEIAVVVVELTTHVVYRAGIAFTYDVARFRAILHAVAGVVICAATTWNGRTASLACVEDSLYAPTHGGQQASERLYHDSCLRTLNAVNYYGIIVALVMLHIDVYVHPLVTGLHFLVQTLTTVFPPFPVTDKFPGWSMPPKELVCRILLMLMGVVVSNIVSLGKHRANQAAFEAALDLIYQVRASKKKMDGVDRLMTSMVPPSALARLLEGRQVFDCVPVATVLFSDMVQFTDWSSNRTSKEVVAMLSHLIRAFDILAVRMEVSKVKTIGDCYWAVTGVPYFMVRHAEVMIRFALAMLKRIQKEAMQHREWDYRGGGDSSSTVEHTPITPRTNHGAQSRRPLQFRTGIHSGPVNAGILGTQQISYEIFGETSVAANSIESNGSPNQVTVSERTKLLSEHANDNLPFGFTIISPPSPDDEKEKEEDHVVVSTLYTVCLLEELPLPCVTGGISMRRQSSLGSNAAEGLDAQAQRRKYIESQLLQRRDESSQRHTTQLSEATFAELSTRYHFELNATQGSADAKLTQAEYKSFALEQMIQFRVGGQIILVGCMLVVFVIYLTESGAEGAMSTFPACSILWVVGLLFATGSAILSLKRREELQHLPQEQPYLVKKRPQQGPQQGLLHSPSPLEDILGPVLAYLGLVCYCVGCILSPSSMLTTDCTWVLPLGVVLVTIPNTHLPTFMLWLGVELLAVLCFINVHLKVHETLLRGFLILGFSAGAHWALPAINAKRMRVQFVGTKVSNHFVKQHAIALQAQRALLTSLLPDFVIDPLTVWIASNYDPAKAVSQQYDCMSVAFLLMSNGAQLLPPAEEPEQPPPAAAAAATEWNSSPSTADEDGESRDESFDWLFAGHVAVDKVLKNNKVVDKVKTVGDLVVVAGSFRGHSGATAAAALLRVVVQIHSRFEEGSITVGVHAGPLMGIVLGFSRLAFDTFGDTVNTASRVAKSATAKHTIAASEKFIELLAEDAPFTWDIFEEKQQEESHQNLKHAEHLLEGPRPQVEAAWGGTSIQYGPVIESHAKGKGVIQIREVQYSK